MAGGDGRMVGINVPYSFQCVCVYVYNRIPAAGYCTIAQSI